MASLEPITVNVEVNVNASPLRSVISVTPDACDSESISPDWLGKVSFTSPFIDLNRWSSWKIRVNKSGEFTVGGLGGSWYVGFSGVNGFVPRYSVETKGQVRRFARLAAIAAGNDPSGEKSDLRREVAEFLVGVGDRFETVDKVWSLLFLVSGDLLREGA